MGNKIRNILLILSLILLASCHKNHQEDPLLLPPDFDVLPDLNDKNLDQKNDQDNKKNSEGKDQKDIKELKDILLQN